MGHVRATHLNLNGVHKQLQFLLVPKAILRCNQTRKFQKQSRLHSIMDNTSWKLRFVNMRVHCLVNLQKVF